MSDTKICGNCGETFTRRTRSPATGYVEPISRFRRRRYCSRGCSAAGLQRPWRPDAIAALEALLRDGLTYAECAAKLSGTMGLRRISEHHVAGDLHRRRGRDTPEPESLPEPVELEPVPEPTPGKHPSTCRYGDCPNTRQPGRDYCAEHQRILVADRVPRVHGPDVPWRLP